jgi:NADPH:quinone reductase-like Zn-dependent oxidoreductase
MKAAALIDFESGLAIRDLPVPAPGEGELLVRVRAASVNNVDVLIARGMLRGMMEYVFPVIPGRDFAGVVEELGDGVTTFQPGEQVLGWITAPILHDGTWAAFVIVAESRFVARKPAALDYVEAASLPLAATTAFGAVEATLAEEGSRVLVVGAGGGVGTFAVQLLAGRGAHVIATAKRGEEFWLGELGAAETVDYTTENVPATVRARYPDGLDAVIDVIARTPEELAPVAALVREGGRVATPLGAASAGGRGVVELNVMADAVDPANLAPLAKLASSGELQVPVAEVFPLEQAAEAVEAFTRGKRGKIALTID